MAPSLRPWPLAAGVVTAVAGAALIVLAPRVPPPASGLTVALAALLELAGGAALTHRHGPGLAQVFTGLLAAGVVLFVAATALFDIGVIGAQPVAEMLGLFCLVNGLF